MHDGPDDPCGVDAGQCVAAEASFGRDFPASCAIAMLARAHRAAVQALLADLGLFPGQEITLMLLWDKDGQSQKALCEAQRLDHSTIAKSLRRLEEVGLVSRTRSDDDARVSLVRLTESGKALRERTEAALAELERRAVADLTDAERATFVALAHRIAGSIDRRAD